MQRVRQFLCLAAGAGCAAAQAPPGVAQQFLSASPPAAAPVATPAAADDAYRQAPMADIDPLAHPEDAVLAVPSAGSPAAAAAAASATTLLPQVRPKGMLTVSSMNVASNSAEGSLIHLGPNAAYSIGADASGNFLVSKAGQPPIIAVDATNKLRMNTKKVESEHVDVSGSVVIRGVSQWALAVSETFPSSVGWSRPMFTTCGGVEMLGGFCKFSSGEVNKTFVGLPPHKQVRVVATYHFIDRWIGEAGYMKLSIGREGFPVVAWTESHAQQESKNGLSICGQEGTPEGKFAVPIDVTVPHLADSLTVGFGSTMEDTDPCDESWGISGFELYLRN